MEQNIEKVVFDILDQNIGVVEVTRATTKVMFSLNNTLHDSRMGSFKNVKCETCGLGEALCEGHFGYIMLNHPVINPCFIDFILKPVLKMFCMGCFKYSCICDTKKRRMRRKPSSMFGDTVVQDTESSRQPPKKLIYYQRDSVYTIQNRGVRDTFFNDNGDPMSLRQLWTALDSIDASETGHLFPQFQGRKISNLVFIRCLLVLPISARPPNMMKGKWFSNTITMLYSKIVRNNVEVQSNQNQPGHILDESIQELQHNVNVLFDTTNSSKEISGYMYNNGGIRNRLDGKEGRLRKNLMGKRCNFTARTVLSGDPMLGISEVGVPASIADNLTIPVIINAHNMAEYRFRTDLKFIKKKDGTMFDLKSHPNMLRSIEVGDSVERPLQNGDYVVINRQPSLHKASMLCCRVRIFQCSTFRLNYSTMCPLNADTDGDEINLHVPQDIMSEGELRELMLADNHIVSAQSSKPIIGLTQDSLLGSFKLSQAIIDEQIWGDIVMAIDADDTLVPPFMIKPRRMWTGIQVLELILKHLGWDYDIDTDLIKIEGSTVVRAVLNKKTLGASSRSLVHYFYLLYGPTKAGEFIHMMQLAANTFLNYEGFSVGIGDCMPVIDNFNFGGVQDMLPTKDEKEESDLVSALQNILLMEPPDGDTAHTNNILAMAQSGSKGSIVNYNQIKRAVCQQIVNGRRMDKEIAGFSRYPIEGEHPDDAKARRRRVFPHGVTGETLEERGFVKNSFIKGLTPTEFWAHSASARISLIDTACKTATTGYLQRKLTKNTENLSIAFDGTVRNIKNNNVIQFRFGRDGVDPLQKM